jgi:hypothetical protein
MSAPFGPVRRVGAAERARIGSFRHGGRGELLIRMQSGRPDSRIAPRSLVEEMAELKRETKVLAASEFAAPAYQF